MDGLFFGMFVLRYDYLIYDIIKGKCWARLLVIQKRRSYDMV